MPQNTPMKRQFTTIDGRTVMSNLPQHWGGNDWKITGVDNPLPVGNYVQTESGVWIPQKGSDDGAADVRLTGRKVKLRRVSESIDETVSAGEDITVTVQPTEGYMITGIVNLYLYARGIPTATKGTHRFEIRIGTVILVYDEVAVVHTNHNNPILFRSWQASSNVLTHPVEKDGFISIVKNIHATEGLPLILRYRNDTDGDQTGGVRIAVFLKEEAVTDD